MKSTSFLVLALEILVGLHRIRQLQLLQHQWLEHRLGLLGCEWFALETNWDHSVIFEIAPKYCILDSFVDNEAYAISSKEFLSISPLVAQSCLTLCDPMNCSMPGFPVHHQLSELTHTHVHQVSDAIQPSHPLSSPCPPAFNLSQHQGLF